jgi:predicted nucleic acid-binding Zn ribbon protein
VRTSSAVRHQPEHVERGLEPARLGYHRIVADILKRAPAEDAARIAWQLVAGAQVAQRTTALGMQDGVLRVRVPDATWLSQLRDFVPQYLAALSSMLGNKVQRIEFVLAEKKASHRA